MTLTIAYPGRRASEIMEKRADFQSNDKEKNANQISFKKDFFKHLQHKEGSSKKIHVFGYDLKMKQFFVLSGLILLFLLSFTGTIVMWFTTSFDSFIYSNLIIRNGSQALEEFKEIGPKALTKIYVFNYTNVEEHERNPDIKLNVKELGPYVYEETMKRENIQFHSDNTISYQESHSIKFRADLSKGKQSDRIVVPNVPLLAGASLARFGNYLQRFAYSTLLKTLKQKPFIKVAMHRFVTGYDDDLYDLSKRYLKFNDEHPMERFGILSSKLGLNHEVRTINSGINGISELGMIKKINGNKQLNYWSTDECNSIRSTDGIVNPPTMIKTKEETRVYVKEFCRTVPFKFVKEATILNGTIPAYKYVMPFSTFDSVEREPMNQCYCNMETGECPMQGLLNVTSCNMGSPIFISFPHFYNGDPKLKEDITGLKEITDPEPIQTYTYVHPTMGFLMAAKNRFQANIQVKKSFGITEVDKFKDNIILPLAWFDTGVEDSELPESFISLLYQVTFTVKGLEYGLKYGTLLFSLVTLGCILVIAFGRPGSRERTSSLRPLKRAQENVGE